MIRDVEQHPNVEDTKKAYKKAQKIAMAFIDECVEKGMTIYELNCVANVLPEAIGVRIQQIEFETKLS